MTFGIMNKPSTPMFDIMEHKYQKKWLKDKHDALKKKEDYDKFEVFVSILLVNHNKRNI